MKPWYQKAVFYHIYPLGLLGAPKTNHEASAACRFDELLQWIPHIRDLGCTALYIGPVFESTGHGYDTRDLHLVDRRLGTNEDFKNFVDGNFPPSAISRKRKKPLPIRTGTAE